MPDREFKTRIQNAREVEKNWEQQNPTLMDGELGIVHNVGDDPDDTRIKIGDGNTPYKEIPFFGDTSKIPKDDIGVPNGVVPLDSNGRIPAKYIPVEWGPASSTEISEVPEQLGSLTYNGEAQVPEWKYFTADFFIVGGSISGKDAGEYVTTFQPAEGYCWSDGSRRIEYVTWTILKKTIAAKPSLRSDDLVYTGVSLTPSWENYVPDEVSISGVSTAINAGEYTASFVPKSNYQWADGTNRTVEIIWHIGKAVIQEVPTQKGTLSYTGATLSPVWEGFSQDRLTISGTTSAAAVGNYTATFTPKANYCWQDGTSTGRTVSWTIGPKVLRKPVQKGAVRYTGESQHPTWEGYDPVIMTISGETSGTDAGTYRVLFTLTEGNKWEDGSTTPVEATWTIERALIDIVPTQKGALSYTGKEQTPLWNNYNPHQLIIGGQTSGTNAGTYTATFTLGKNSQWADGTTGSKNATWTIGQAQATLKLVPDKLAFAGTGDRYKDTFEAQSESTGSVSAASINTAIATASVSGNTITVTPVALGSTSIRVNVADDLNYLAPIAKDCSITIMNGRMMSAAEFQQLIYDGLGPSTYSPGDSIGIPAKGEFSRNIVLDGIYYPQILGFNHNYGVEGTIGNYVDLQWTAFEDGTQVAFCDDPTNVMITDGVIDCRMNMTMTNVGGYDKSMMCQEICPAFFELIDPEWQAVIIPALKYTDNVGNKTTAATNVTPVEYMVWLLGQREVFTTGSYVNTGEINYQKQYDMYQNGVLARRFNGNDSNELVRNWWLRSPYTGSTQHFLTVYCSQVSSAPSQQGYYSHYTAGFAPGMRIGKLAPGALKLEPSKLNFIGTGDEKEQKVTIDCASTGGITVVSNDPKVATVERNGKVLTITPKAKGATRVTVTVGADTNWPELQIAECSLAVNKNITASEFNTLVRAGNGPNVFTPGDTLPIHLDGTIGRDVHIKGLYFPQILGFNHNQELEGTRGNYVDIIWTSIWNGIAIAFTDMNYGNQVTDMIVDFRMNRTETNVGGYDGSMMAQQLCPTFLEVIDPEWRILVCEATKYTDNVGNGQQLESSVTAGRYKIWLLAEFEGRGSRGSANQYEQYKQQKYDGYKNGIGSTRYNHTAIGNSIGYWTRSPYCGNAIGFIGGLSSGYYKANSSNGFAPCCRMCGD